MPHKPSSEAAPQTKGSVIRWARIYDAVSWVMSFGRATDIRMMTVELADVQQGERVLDVGCGTGTLTMLAGDTAGSEGEVWGIDPSPEMIEIARGKAAKARSDVRFEVGLIESIPLPDGHLDVVLSSLMLHHLPEDLKRKGFAEIHRVIKPGGRLVAVDINEPENRILGRLLMTLFFHPTVRSSPRRLAEMMEDVGFTQVEVSRTRYPLLASVRGRRPDTS